MNFSNVGKNLTRVDGKEKVLGKAKYPNDLYVDNMLYGVTLRSTEPHADFKLDISEAEKLDGVVKILTYKDIIGANHQGVLFKDQQVLCENRVKRIGDPIAFIVAESEKIAYKAKNLIKVQYEKLEAVFDPIDAMKDSSPKLHGDSNIVYHYKCRKGNIEEGFKNSHVIIEKEFKTSMVEHAFLQTESGVSYLEEDGTVVVIVATQYPHFDQIEIAEALGLPAEKVRVITSAVGGAFGGREDITVQIHVALAALITKRPVKVNYSREESFYAHSKRHPIHLKYKMGADKNGKLTALEAEIIGDTGAYASWAINVLRKAGVHASGPYEIPNVKIDSYAVYTNNPYAGAMRGFGATQVPVATEQMMDMIAEKLNMTPVDIRLKNCFHVNSITATGQTMSESVPIENCIKAVADKLYSSNKVNKNRGKGIGASFYGTGYGNGFPDVSTAIVGLEENGKISISVGATEVGQGAKTALSQIGAEVLGVPLGQIVFINEDTNKTPDSGTAAASRQTYNTGNAIKVAMEAFKERLFEIVKDELNLNSTKGLEVGKTPGGYAVSLKILPSKSIYFKEIYNRLKEKNMELKVKESFTAQTTMMDAETGQGAPYWPYVYNCYGVEVEVDTETGKVDIVRAVCAQDVGKAINPKLVEGQIDGGFAMGVGYALLEDLGVNKGKISNNKFARYLIPTSLDIPEIEKILIEDPESTAPYGAKGIGEAVMIPVAPAVLNAIYDAVGVRIYDLPASPEKVLKALKELEMRNK